VKISEGAPFKLRNLGVHSGLFFEPQKSTKAAQKFFLNFSAFWISGSIVNWELINLLQA
jgi:hypothetical protein